MLHRNEPSGRIIISQPAHAWISEQMARAWGNEQFGQLQPAREVILAAGQHDIGWLEWESAPTLNPETGLPYTFRELPTFLHLSIWGPAGNLALAYGRYTALLVSLHGSGLYRRFHDYDRDTDEEAEAARAFLRDSEGFESQLTEDLQADDEYAEYSTDAMIERNRRLVANWDGISLAICHGIEESTTFSGVPGANGDLDITFTNANGQGTILEVDPWPFGVDSLRVGCEGRRLDGTFADEPAMQIALSSAPWVRLEFELRPR